MIVLTRLGGATFALNPDLVERAEATPDTVITLVDGTKYVVAETVEQVVARIREFRAAVISAAHRLDLAAETAAEPTEQPRRAHLTPVADAPVVVRMPVREG